MRMQLACVPILAALSCAHATTTPPMTSPPPPTTTSAAPATITVVTPNAPIVSSIGCTHDAQIDRRVTLPRGRWRLVVEYHGECDDNAVVTVGGAQVIPLSGLAQVMSRCPLEQTSDTPVAVELLAQGGLHCGGNFTVERIAFEPADSPSETARAWSADRCRWLARTVENALSSGGARRARDVIRETLAR